MSQLARGSPRWSFSKADARAHEELEATGARPRKVLRGGEGALTAAERRVARLAADGHTNDEIARSLVVSRRTVESHLAHAYEKLGIHSRRELGRVLTLR